MRCRVPLVATALLLGVSAVSGLQFSSAEFVDSSSMPVDVTSAHDWTPPTVSLADPGSEVGGTVALTATAADARSAIDSVRIEYATPSAPTTWVTVCTDSSAPYSCPWNTTTVPDGSPYQLRAVALDTAGYSAQSAVHSTRVTNASLDLAAIATPARGTVALSAQWYGAGTVSVAFETSTDGSSWSTISGCGAQTASPVAGCSWVTSGAATHYVRAVASHAGTTYSDFQYPVVVDNVAPTLTLTVPPSNLSDTATLSASPSDTGSGVASVTFEYRAGTTGTWSACGTDSSAPYSCDFVTTNKPDGTYQFQARATDLAGNQSAYTATQTRTVQNASVAVTSPTSGQVVSGIFTVQMSATAGYGTTVSSVLLQAREVGTSTWIDVCTDTAAPYQCPADTRVEQYGQWEARAIMTQANSVVITSATVAFTINNVALAAYDVQASVNGGLPAPGDMLTLTYTTKVDPSTIMSGWNGSATTVPVVFNASNVSGTPLAGADWIQVTGTNLGKVSLTGNYVDNGGSATFTNATMEAFETTVGGYPATYLRIILGTGLTNGGVLNTVGSAGGMRWYPTASVRSTGGAACGTGFASESGTGDRDF